MKAMEEPPFVYLSRKGSLLFRYHLLRAKPAQSENIKWQTLEINNP